MESQTVLLLCLLAIGLIVAAGALRRRSLSRARDAVPRGETHHPPEARGARGENDEAARGAR